MRGTEREKTLPEIQKAKLRRQHCRQNDDQVVEPAADGTWLIVIVTWLIVIVFGERGKQEYRQIGREYHQRDNDNRMKPSEGRKHPYLLRKNTELTGFQLVVYTKRSASSSKRKLEGSRKNGGAFGELTLTPDSYLRI